MGCADVLTSVTVFSVFCRYVQFVKSDAMVYLQDKVGVVISVPPLTNSEATKVKLTCLPAHKAT